MSFYRPAVTYERALKAGLRGDAANAAQMAVEIEFAAAEWGLRTGSIPYAFSPKAVWEGAQRRGLSALQVMILLCRLRPGVDAASFLQAELTTEEGT